MGVEVCVCVWGGGGSRGVERRNVREREGEDNT